MLVRLLGELSESLSWEYLILAGSVMHLAVRESLDCCLPMSGPREEGRETDLLCVASEVGLGRLESKKLSFRLTTVFLCITAGCWLGWLGWL